MVQTQDFCTKTAFIPRKNAATGDFWGVALDIGYSAVKGMSPNHVFCFPSFARKASGQTVSIGEASPHDIQYRDESGAVWNVGTTAQNQVSSTDSNDSLQSLYGRNRYFSPMFLVLARVGLGLGLLTNEHGAPDGKTLVLQTGLPPAYLRADAMYLKEVLAGQHRFELRIGNGPWQAFDFELPEKNIRVMAQPMGSFFSAVLGSDASQLPIAKTLFNSNVLIFDAGFGTVDIYSVRNRQIESSQSFDDCGMKAVLAETSAELYARYRVEAPVHTMQKPLREGTVKYMDRRAKASKAVEFADILEQASEKVCRTALERMESMYDALLDYDYLLITGGTGAAWQDIITDNFSGMETLKIITGSQNDTLSHVFSNVRGYYLYQAGSLQRLKKG